MEPTLIILEVIFLFFAAPFLYFYHQKKYMAFLAITQNVLNATLAFCILMYPSNRETYYPIIEMVFHSGLIVSSALVLIVTGRVFVESMLGIFGKK